MISHHFYKGKKNLADLLFALLYADTFPTLGLLVKESLSPYDLYGGGDKSLLTQGKEFSP